MSNDRKRPTADELAAAVVDDFEASGPVHGDHDDQLEGYEAGADEFDEAWDENEDDGYGYGGEAGEGEPYDTAPSSGLLSFYDRLRGGVTRFVERKAGKVGGGVVRVLLTAPDIFMLLVRLALDKQVPKASRTLVGGGLAYFLLPTDFLPEALLGVGGYVDDVVLAAAVLTHVFGDLEEHARRHWSGPEDLRVVLKDITRVGQSLLGESLFDRLQDFLARRGIELEGGSGGAAAGGGGGYDEKGYEATEDEATDYDATDYAGA